VVEYSSRRLTKETDRLPALSGLSKQIQAAGLALVSGVPPTYIHRWLMWKPSGLVTADRRPSFIAPSWSWASYPSSHALIFLFQGWSPQTTDYEIPPIEFETIAQFLGIASEAAGVDPTGALKFGRLSLYTYVASVTLRFERELALERSYRRTMDYTEDEFNLTTSPGKEVLCALISRGATTDRSNSIRTYCLILNAVQDSTYQRVGTFSYDWATEELPWDGFELRKITII